jgi:hypothetical protein
MGDAELFVIIGMFVLTFFGLLFTFYQITRSIKVAVCNVETVILRDLNEWTTKLDSEKTSIEKKLSRLCKVLNILQHLLNDVKRSVYPFDDYLEDFFHFTLFYILELEKLCIEKKKNNKTLSATRKFIKNNYKVLLPVFEIYEEKSIAFLEKEEKDRTPDNLKIFLESENCELDRSEKKRLKREIKPGLRSAMVKR